MNNIEIGTLVGVVFNNTEIKLDSSESKVKAAIGIDVKNYCKH